MKTNQQSPRRRLRYAALAVVAVIALASCSDKGSDGDVSTGKGGSGTSGTAAGSGGSGSGSDQTIRISSQDFSEQKTLAQVYGQYLKAQGFDVDIQDPIGTRTQVLAALKSGKLDMEIDYSGPALLELKGTPTADAEETYSALTDALKSEDLTAAEQSEAEDSDALVTLKSYADSNSLKTISDLAELDGPLTLGGAAECAERDQCLKGYNGEKYALGLKFKVVDYGPPLVEALKADEIQVAQYGTTAPEISTGEIVVLDDDKGLLPAANVVPVVRSEVSSDKLTKALDTVSAKLTTKDLAEWNQATDVKKEDPADVAETWLKDNGLL